MTNVFFSRIETDDNLEHLKTDGAYLPTSTLEDEQGRKRTCCGRDTAQHLVLLTTHQTCQ